MPSSEGTPFRAPLHEHSKFGRDFKQIGENSDFVVRFGHRIFDKKTEAQRNNIPQKEYLEDTRLFTELSKFNINVPVNVVVGKDEEGHETVYLITDTITGVTLNEVSAIGDNPSFGNKLVILHKNLIDYIDTKVRQHDVFLIDITRGDQYVYGSKPNGLVKDIYLVDVEPRIASFHKPLSYHTRTDYKRHIDYYTNVAIELEALAMEIHGPYCKNENPEALRKFLGLIDFLDTSLQMEIENDHDDKNHFLNIFEYISRARREVEAALKSVKTS